MIKLHAGLLLYSFLTWLSFYLLGLPEYYQQWYLWAKLFIVVAVTVMYFPVSRITIEKFWNNGKHFKNACWLAFYLTVPLFIYDYLLLGLYKGLGINFVIPYWYLTFFYFSFWLQIPWVGWTMERQSKNSRQTRT